MFRLLFIPRWYCWSRLLAARMVLMYPLEDNVDEDDLKAAVVLCFYHFPLCSMHATIYNLYVYSLNIYIYIYVYNILYMYDI